MLRLLALALWIGACPAFALNAARIQCTTQNALLELIPMTGYFNTVEGRVKTETPFHFWLARDAKTAAAIESKRKADDDSKVLVMNHAIFYWQVDDHNLEMNLERTLRAESFSETNDQGVMLVGMEGNFLAGWNGWMFSCQVIETN